MKYLTKSFLLFTLLNFKTIINCFSQNSIKLGSFKSINWPSNIFSNSIELTDKFLFSANDGINGNEVWISDGTIEGTFLLHDINVGGDSNPRGYYKFKDEIYFFADDNLGTYLFKTNGLKNGLKKLSNNLGTNYVRFVEFNNLLYFLNGNFEMWKTDGTEKGTEKTLSSVDKILQFSIIENNILLVVQSKNTLTIKKINNLNELIVIKEFPFPDYGGITSNKNHLYFSADDGIHGMELWKSDGTIGGTIMVKDIAEKTSFPRSMISNGKYILFMANDHKNNLQRDRVWVSDGTMDGTKILINSANKEISLIINAISINEKIYFTGPNLESTPELGNGLGTYVYDTKTDTLKYISNYVIGYFSKMGDHLYFLYCADSDKCENKKLLKLNIITDEILELNPQMIYKFDHPIKIVKNNWLSYRTVNSDIAEIYSTPLCIHSAKITTSNGTSFCPGSSVIISGEATGTTSPFTYSWKSGTTDAGTNASLTVSKAGNYTLEVKDKEGCVVSASVDITQTANLPVAITGTNNICSGQNTILTATPIGGEAPFTYQWKLGGVNVGTNTQTLSANAGGGYTVEIKDKNGCVGTASNFTVTAKQSPNVTITKSGSQDFLPGSSIVLSVPTATGQTYQWNKNAIAITGATNNSYTVTTEGKYTVTVVGNGCTATSEPLETKIITGIEQEPVLSNIKLTISPNPAEDFVKVTIDLPKPSKAELVLKDITGKTVIQETFGVASKQHKTSLNLKSMPAGVYFVVVEAGREKVVRKVVK